ncbi:MAG: transposase [Deltaproteobacteria bacterium]|nr:transposase [Deltaproteobacteria bacterium]
MKSARKHHSQQELFRHGGRRRGAGRPITPGRTRASERHLPRPRLTKHQAAHVTLRVVPSLALLRDRDFYKAIRRAMWRVYEKRRDCRITGVSVQGSHIHLLVEAASAQALSRGMQALQISAARHINRAYSKRARLGQVRRGQVFADRYNEEVIDNPRQARHAWSYVLNNWRKHGEQRVPELRTFTIDPFSSAIAFDGWTEPIDEHWPATYEPLPVHAPRTWLLATGWRRYGLIDPREVPGRRRGAAHR